MNIDFNCDTGEGTGNDEALMPFISSANIACGYHAGAIDTIYESIQFCLKYNVAIGAHPSYYDRTNFGRTDINLTPDEVYDLITQQLIIFQEVANNFDAGIRHVKPHGALYNMSARDIPTAAAIAAAIKDFQHDLMVVGLSGSHSITEAAKLGLRAVNEVFADRAYASDGSLVPRTQAGALITDTDLAARQALQLIRQQNVTTITGETIPVIAETICIHGDGANAIEFAKNISAKLKQHQIEIKAI